MFYYAPGQSIRNEHIRDLAAIMIEARACLRQAGFSANTAEVFEFARLVWIRKAREREIERMAELLDDGTIEIEFAYRNGDEAVLKAKRNPSSTAC